MARQKIPYRTSVAIRYEHPVDDVAQNPLDNTNDGATCSFKVYDPSKSEVLSAAEASGQTVLSVTDAGVFAVGETVEVDLDAGGFHASSVSAVDPIAGTITIAAGLPSAAGAGRRVRVRLGSSVSMVEYGTAKLGRTDWGFVGTLASDFPGLYIDREIDIEISFVGAPGGGLDALAVICAVVSPVEDCDECE